MAKQSDKRSNRVFLSLGSNEGLRLENLKEAIKLLSKEVGSIGLVSHAYETEAWGNSSLLPFYNLVLEIFTELKPGILLNRTQSIEMRMGRKNKTGLIYENRLIDIDILWYNNEQFELEGLDIPHVELKNRRFVLEPFSEIASELEIGNSGQTVSSLLKTTSDIGKVLKVSLLK